MSVRTRRKAKEKQRRFFASLSRDQHRDFLRRLADHGEEYAGIPAPIEGEKLIVHPSYRFAKVFQQAPKADFDDPEDAKRYRVRNSWRNARGFDVFAVEDTTTGRVLLVKAPPARNRLAMEFGTMGCASAWELKCELRAQEKLKTLIKEHLFEMYQLTGAFLETSKRSEVTYMFRRLKPTIALSGRTGEIRALCCLCLHPIGYYDGTWAGSMVPTDEVIAHLMLMRGDESDFWRQANQHPAWRAESGL